MNEFDRRWKITADAARDAAPLEHEELPFGLATRVLARRRSASAPPIAMLWQRIALRALSALVFLFAALATWSALVPDDPAELRPLIEETVSQSFWIL